MSTLNWKVTIFTSWKRYKKLIPAVIGFVVLITLKNYDIELPGFTAVLLDWLVAAAGTFGVYQLKNEPKPEAITIEAEVKQVK